MAALDHYLDDQARLEAEAQAEARRLQDELLELARGMPPVDRHNMEVRVRAAGDDLERLELLRDRVQELEVA